MEVKDVSSIHEKSFQNVSFKLRKGEILGFGGLVGAQRTELMEGIFGIRHIATGESICARQDRSASKNRLDAMDAGYRYDYGRSTWQWYLRMPFH
jgi:methyl-galactoside transport system ATP-binding protein